MGIWIALAGVFGMAAALACFLIGRVVGKRRAATGTPSADLVELARLQERERGLNHEISRLSVSAETAIAQVASLQNDNASVREKLAAAEEKAANTQQALSNESASHAAAVKALNEELATVKEAREKLQLSLTEEMQKVSAAAQMEIELRDRRARADGYIGERDKKIGTLEDEASDLRRRLAAKDSELAAAGERETALNRTVAEREEQLQGLQEHLKTEFKNIATDVLKAATDQLSVQSHQSLSSVLTPLEARLKDFKDRIDAVHSEDQTQRSALEAQIRLVTDTGRNLGDQAEALTKALKGDSGLRGRWAEVRLERILEMSGLERGREFLVQGGDLNIKNEEGRSQRPDVIILLPESRHLIIDSKLSLVSYLEYEAAESDVSRASALKELLTSCRKHIDDLAEKSYQHGDAINSHDLVLMFMPIEGAAAIALKGDATLFEYAWSRKVVIVSPGSLFLAMQTVNSIWRYERQNLNAKVIATRAGQLYDKLVGFVKDLNEVSAKIQAAASAHSEALKKLSSGRGNALARAERLKELGAVSKSNMPFIMIDGQRTALLDEDEDEDEDESEFSDGSNAVPSVAE